MMGRVLVVLLQATGIRAFLRHCHSWAHPGRMGNSCAVCIIGSMASLLPTSLSSTCAFVLGTRLLCVLVVNICSSLLFIFLSSICWVDQGRQDHIYIYIWILYWSPCEANNQIDSLYHLYRFTSRLCPVTLIVGQGQSDILLPGYCWHCGHAVASC